MSEAADIRDRVAVKDTELLDWAETDVISIGSHPSGWEIWWAGPDNEPATPDAVLFKTLSIRDALAQAKARQSRQEADREMAGAVLGVPERVDDAGCD